MTLYRSYKLIMHVGSRDFFKLPQEEEPEVSVPRPMAVRVHVPLKKAVASVSGSPAEKQIISKELVSMGLVHAWQVGHFP